MDTTPPTISITHPEPGFTAEVSDVLVEWTGSDETSWIDHYEIRIDYRTWEDVGTETSYTLTLHDGEHTITVKAFDFVGHENTARVSFTVNTSPIGGPGMMEEILIGVGVGVAIAIAAVAVYNFKIKKE